MVDNRDSQPITRSSTEIANRLNEEPRNGLHKRKISADDMLNRRQQRRRKLSHVKRRVENSLVDSTTVERPDVRYAYERARVLCEVATKPNGIPVPLVWETRHSK